MVRCISCTDMDWLYRSHRAVKKRRDRVSCGRPHSFKGPFVEQGVASCEIKQRTRESTNCTAHRKGKPRKMCFDFPGSGKRSGVEGATVTHGRTVLSQVAGLLDDLLQHVVRNARNTQLQRSTIQKLSASK